MFHRTVGLYVRPGTAETDPGENLAMPGLFIPPFIPPTLSLLQMMSPFGPSSPATRDTFLADLD
jgi:hypothetical protein